jgi:hypothetical protein
MRAVGKTISAFGAVAALALCAAPASAASVVNASWNAACGKSTCFDQQGVYTHSWSAGDVGGPITVGGLTLDRSILGSFDSHMFRLSFQVGGQEIGSWGNYLMGGIGGDVLTFTGQAFAWNPEDGDLVLVLQLTPPPQAGARGFAAFNINENNPLPNQDGPNDDGPSNFQDGGAGFQSGGPSAAPEPTTWALMMAGFGGAGAMLRRRRAAVA